MKKLANIRAYLNQKIPYLKQNPESLYLFVENGHVISTLADTPSYEYQYTLNIIIERYTGDQDILIAVVNDWLRQHQSDIAANPSKRQQDFKFEAVILDNSSAHISIDLNLTERVLAKDQDGKWLIDSIAEPANPFDHWATEQ